ncbi:glutamate--cysteine ligase [Pseudobdellovibrio exovorus]|uniref:Putative glutamate--cysteine ligase n=1 Tax=Pseudobdellovibrio exovorus JSS TaxID=1184267 RepID=M4V4Y6_9BACT|nr:glutamate--cysteine ligase [Pseudobdellovibrio exovorus]AGH94402.1 putative glutamate--cysteine ligase [Pseudobdellovibrio exovorus JSS]
MNFVHNSPAQSHVHDQICAHYPELQKWFSSLTSSLSYPIYSSYDIRDSGYKIANVDANIYPAGFNNICPTDKETSVDLFKKYIQVHYQFDVKKILLVTEEHTKNPYYLENAGTIAQLLTEAGYDVRMAFPRDLPETLTLESVTGRKLQIGSGYENSAWIKDFQPDLVISNNDFSLALEEWAQQLTLPMNPPRELGWYQRKKSRYFKNYNALADDFAKIVQVDPFLMRVETEEFLTFDINSDQSRDQLAQQVDQFLKNLKQNYQKQGITDEPFCFVKNNAGTYGLGVIKVNSASEIKEWTYNARKKMKAAKGGRSIEQVIIQEGIPSVVKADEAAAEPVIYMIGCELAGGFLRTHAEKSSTESLNSPGAVYKKLCVTDLYDDRARCPQENVYGWSAKLGLLAIGLEAKDMNIEFSRYTKARCGSI